MLRRTGCFSLSCGERPTGDQLHMLLLVTMLCCQRRAGESHRGRDEECQEVPSDGAPQEEVTISVCQEQRVTQEPGSGGYRGSGSPGQLVSAMKILFVSHDEFLYILINQQILHCQLMLSSLIICTQVTGLLRFCHHRIINKIKTINRCEKRHMK